MRKITRQLKKLKAFYRAVMTHCSDINTTIKAAALAYTTLLSLVPFMVLSFGFMLAFPSLSPYFQSLHRFLFSHLIPASAHVIQRHVETFADNATHLSTSGLIFFMVTSVLLVFNMETVFNTIWQVRHRRKGFRAFLIYWAVLTLIAPLGALGVALTIFLNSLPLISFLLSMATYFIPFVLTFLGYVFLYMTVPNCSVRFSNAAIGASVASVAFELTKELFRLYVANFSSDAIVYGVLSVIPVFLFWLYVCWIITIFGAVIAQQAGVRPNEKARYSASPHFSHTQHV